MDFSSTHQIVKNLIVAYSTFWHCVQLWGFQLDTTFGKIEKSQESFGYLRFNAATQLMLHRLAWTLLAPKCLLSTTTTTYVKLGLIVCSSVKLGFIILVAPQMGAFMSYDILLLLSLVGLQSHKVDLNSNCRHIPLFH